MSDGGSETESHSCDNVLCWELGTLGCFQHLLIRNHQSRSEIEKAYTGHTSSPAYTLLIDGGHCLPLYLTLAPLTQPGEIPSGVHQGKRPGLVAA